LEQLVQIGYFQRLQHIDLTAGEEGANHLERGIFRGRPDQDEGAVFHRSEQGILLRFAEPVDFVDEQDGGVRLGIEKPVVLGFLDDFPHVLDARTYCTQCIERTLQLVGDDARQGRLAHAWRPPQDKGGDVAGIDHLAQDRTLSDQVFLTDVIVQFPGTEPFCQRLCHRCKSKGKPRFFEQSFVQTMQM
jgi:hypothetical protein